MEPSLDVGNVGSVVLGGELHQHFYEEHHHVHQHYHNVADAAADDVTGANVATKAKRLQELLRKSASLACETITPPVKLTQAIKPVTLSMTQNPKRADEDERKSGHYEHRKELDDFYLPNRSDVTEENMFDCAKKRAVLEAKRNCSSETSREEFVEKRGSVVGVVGQAGIGKTTTVKRWVKSVLDNRILPQVTFLILIFVRAMDFSNEGSLLECLLVSSCFSSWEHTPEMDKTLLKILNADKGIVIFVDGLDEAPIESPGARVPQVGLFDRAKPWTFLMNLLNGNLLPNSKKIVTSRPGFLYSLNPVCRPLFNVQILGLNAMAQDELGLQICGSKYAQVKEILQENERVFAYCYVPVNFVVTCDYLLNNDHDPETLSMTGILAYTCEQYTRTDHLQGSDCEVDKLALLAWTGHNKQQILFKSNDFSALGIHTNTVQAFLSTSVTKSINLAMKILSGDKRCYFSHLIWQEFFAAVYLMLLAPKDVLSSTLNALTHHRYEVVTTFMFGLCNEKPFRRLLKVIPHCSLDVWESKRTLLQNWASALVFNISEENFLQVCAWTSEANIDDFTRAIARKLPEKLKIRGFVHPADVSYLINLLKKSDKPHALQCCYSRWRGECLERFTSILPQSGAKVSSIDFAGYRIGNAGLECLANCIGFIKQFQLKNCGIGVEGIRVFSSKLLESGENISQLELSGNIIGDEGCVLLARCASQIEYLKLSACYIGIVGLKEIAKFLKMLPTPMKLLRLSCNEIGEEGAEILSQCVGHLEELHIAFCRTTGRGIALIARQISELDRQMVHLCSSANQLNMEAILAASQCLHNLNRISLGFCGLDVCHLQILANGVAVLRHQMEVVCLNGNHINEAGVAAIASCLHNIQTLKMKSCNLGVAELKILAKRIKKLSQPMQKIDLGKNDFGSEGIKVLAPCLFRIIELCVSECGIGRKGARALEAATKNNKLGKLNLSMNPIGSDGAMALARCINKFSALDLCWTQIGSTGIQRIASAIVEKQYELESLELSRDEVDEEARRALTMCRPFVKCIKVGYSHIPQEVTTHDDDLFQ